MNYNKHFEENITDDILDENISRPAFIRSLHLETKTPATPFDQVTSVKKFRKVASLPISDYKNDGLTGNFEPSCENKGLLMKKASSKTQFSTNKIQADIRNLLQKAIQIRNIYSFECELDESPKFGTNECHALQMPKGEEVTVGDLHNPFNC
ncbi:unnamed protein product [Moneuplotes crassus]|uniref:Uncharacterized protein n=1 Tax=Euplotes crassus TaxID=5936 RepID=A0AAD1UKB7_EUPCR|nr:unnamed protein product [Moneuplotes crassus]